MKHIINIIITSTLALSFSSVCNAAWADSSFAEVRLVATINNGPAFRKVSWEVFRVDGSGEKLTSDRHTFVIDSLKPGRYTVRARTGERPDNQTVKERNFYVMADTTNKINIPLD